jgi:hypothetical protein
MNTCIQNVNKTYCYIRGRNMDLISNRRECTENFERKLIRKIYGPVMENNIWRIRYNEEINPLLKGENNSKIYQVTENKMVGAYRKTGR